MKFCGQCGSKLTPTTPNQPSSPQPRAEGERRHVTALFADLKGYTSISESLGEEGAYRLVERLCEAMTLAILEEGGSVQKFTGDGVFALFGAPQAFEDAPLRACRAALGMQARVRGLSKELLQSLGVTPQIRIGIHTGPVVLGGVGAEHNLEVTALGDTVNLASRIESLAEPGTAYISEATHSIVTPYVESVFMGERTVKGKARPQRLYRLEAVKDVAEKFHASVQRGLVPFLGREEELDTLAKWCGFALEGKRMLALVVGEPGIGKTRLMHEFKSSVEGKGFSYIKGHCSALGQTTPLLPFVEIIRNLFHIEEDDGLDTARQKLHKDLAKGEPYILNFLGYDMPEEVFRGLDARIIGERTKAALKASILAACGHAPVALMVEDLHWVDQATEVIIAEILQDKPAVPILILATARPSYTSPPWAADEAALEIKLLPLSPDSAASMVKNILGSAHVDDSVTRLISEKTGCNPFFMEELTRYLLENGSLKKTGHAVLYELLPQRATTVPASIRDLLQARVDKLMPGPRALLQTASIIGQKFPIELLREASAMGDDAIGHLSELEAQDLVFRNPDGELRFKHALLQDVVHDNLLTQRKAAIHRAVGQAIEKLYPNQSYEWAESLAHHWGAAGDLKRAYSYTELAGEKSLRLYALKEALQRFEMALQILEQSQGAIDDSALADLLAKWMLVFSHTGDYKTAQVLMEKHISRIEAQADKAKLAICLTWLGYCYITHARMKEAMPLLNRALELAEETGDLEALGYANARLIWPYCYWWPEHEEADRQAYHYFQRACAVQEKLGDYFIGYSSLMGMAVHTFTRGRFGESRQCSARLVEIGQRLGDTRYIATGLTMLGHCNIFEERYQEALENAEACIAMEANPIMKRNATVVKGVAMALTGNIQEGLSLLRNIREELLSTNMLLPIAGMDIPYGALLVLGGQMAGGVNHIHKAMKYWDGLGNYTQPVRGHLFLGDIYTRMALGVVRPSPKTILNNAWFIITNKPFAKYKARHHLSEVLRLAEQMRMPGFLAKAHLNLGLICRREGDIASARTHIEEALRIAKTIEPSPYAEIVQNALGSLNP